MRKKVFLIVVCLLLVSVGLALMLHAEGERGHRQGKRNSFAQSAPANAEYSAACGECHFAYQPWLLPAASWKKHLAGLEDHFGSVVVLSPAQRQNLGTYLAENAADTSSDRRARRMLQGVEGQAPLRITELPCIQRKHHSLDAGALKRPSVGGLGNCPACHTTAAQGDDDDRNVRIPQ